MRGLLAGILTFASLLVGTGVALAEQPAPAPAWSRPPRVGLQVGHWYAQQLPDEQADLRDNPGADWQGWREVDVNYAVTQAAAEALRAGGVRVDVLPATVPPGYKADAFVAVHADQDLSGRDARGWKVAPSAFTMDKADSQRLAGDVGQQYAQQTELPADLRAGAITPDMRLYYAFNWRYYQHAVAPSTPAAIVELGFISDEADREVLYGQPYLAGRALAGGILQYLEESAGL
jgi:N-acetylmuramoyl-L-alanine amidase